MNTPMVARFKRASGMVVSQPLNFEAHKRAHAQPVLMPKAQPAPKIMSLTADEHTYVLEWMNRPEASRKRAAPRQKKVKLIEALLAVETEQPIIDILLIAKAKAP